MSIAGELAAFLVRTKVADLPPLALERARMAIGKFKAATVGRLLWAYFVIRQAAAAVGLTSLGGHPQMVRPLIAPMAQGAAQTRYGPLPVRER